MTAVRVNIIYCIVLTLAALPMCGGCVDGPTPSPPPFSAIVVFGDSLSDTGNVFNETNLIPPAPYFNGRFSGDEIWVDHVARHFGLPLAPAYLGGTNFAHGGAGAARGAPSFGFVAFGFNVREQVAWYLDGRTPRGDELFVVWAGANDLFDFIAGQTDLTPQQSADDVSVAITVLYDAGARLFLVPNAPNLGLIPRYRFGPREDRATMLTAEFNAALSERLDDLERLREIRIMRVDIESIVTDLVENPPPEFTNTTEPAWTGDVLGYLGGGALNDQPDEYLFWDEIHPGRIAHAMLAATIIARLEAESGELPPGATYADISTDHWSAATSFWFRFLGL